MGIAPGHYTLGPQDATLTVRTRKSGAASKAGHNLRIEVTSWRATLDVAEEPADTALALTADPRSLRVREGTGGIQALGDDDKASIEETIDGEVLDGAAIEFRSRRVAPGGAGGLAVEGGLGLAGKRHPGAVDPHAAGDAPPPGDARGPATR